MTSRTLFACALLLSACPSQQTPDSATAGDTTSTGGDATTGPTGTTAASDTSSVGISACEKLAAAQEAVAMVLCPCAVADGSSPDLATCLDDHVAAANPSCVCDLEADPMHADYVACLADADLQYKLCVEPFTCDDQSEVFNCNGVYVEAVTACDQAAKASAGAFAVQCQSAAAFLCDSGDVISAQYACDDTPDCKDMSDESKATCTFVCDDGQEILILNKCDGTPDCEDTSDEAQELCYFECDDGLAIPKSWVCDGNVDCDDMADEADCP